MLFLLPTFPHSFAQILEGSSPLPPLPALYESARQYGLEPFLGK